MFLKFCLFIKGNVGDLKAAGKRYIPIDWSLKTKMRFLSEKSFPWSQKLRTCEEASGTSGYDYLNILAKFNPTSLFKIWF